MKVKQAIAEITAQRKEKISYEKMGAALNLTRQRVGQMLNDDLSEKQILSLENHFNVNLTNVKQIIDDKTEIQYWADLPEEHKNPKVRSVWFDKEIIENTWKLKADSLAVVTMIGDYLTDYWYKINNGDLLIIDTKQTDITENGIYFATSQNGQKHWVREMEEFFNGDVEFRRYLPTGKEIKKYSRQELIDGDFKVIGRVIKNVSFKL